MAQVTIRANLSSVQIPLLTEEFGRSVIVRQQDLNYVPTVTSKADIDKDVGIPQVYYAHNVMPTNYGYRSVAFSTQIPGIGVSTFSQVFSLLSPTGQKAMLGVNTDGFIYKCVLSSGYIWSPIQATAKAIITEGANTGSGYIVSATVRPIAFPASYAITFTSATAFDVTRNGSPDGSGTVGTEYNSADGIMDFTINTGETEFIAGDSFSIVQSAATFLGAVTQATLSGTSYIASAGQGIFQYDFATNSLVWRYAVGLDSTQLLGITSANGYMIAYSTDTVSWSSVIDQLDFLPSLSTGAGGGSVEEAKGPIRRCVSLTSGFIVFTAANAVAATFTQNIRYPFIFKEIANAGGISDLSLVTDEADSTAVYAFTSNGMQQISAQKAQTIMPELSDLLTGRRFEDFDSSTLDFSTLNTSSPLKKRVEYISGRFLVISYGISSFTHAIVYDTALQRFGKIKLPHVASFQYAFLDADDADTPKKQIAFLQSDGTVRTINFAAGITSPDSVILLGKFQFIRNRLLQLQAVELESVDIGESLALYDYATEDGKTFTDPIAGYAVPQDGMTRLFRFRTTGMNHSFLLKGTFRLNSMQLTFNLDGRR